MKESRDDLNGVGEINRAVLRLGAVLSIVLPN